MIYKRVLAGVAAAALFANISGFSAFGVQRASMSLYDSGIGMGISYTKQAVTEGSIKKVLNVITCDLQNSGADIVFSKAKDVEKKTEVLSKQVQRESYKGNNVVAAINGDMFDMGLGYSSGPQIRNGAILTNHNAKYEEDVYPVFGIDNNRKAFINYLHMDAKVSLASTTSGAINIAPDGTYSDPYSMAIDSVNRENCKDKLVLVDYQMNQGKTIDISKYISQNTTSIVRISGVTGSLLLGTEYVGTVEKVGVNAKTSDIPKNGVLLCASGAKAKWLNANFKPGDKIKLQVEYERNDIREAIGAYSYFIRDGRVLTNDEMIASGAKSDLVKARKARTAIGITAENKVIAITVDGGTPSKGVSDGITLLEMAKLLKDMGAQDAVAFDGGGSTQMNAKLYGESSVSILTKPSDGRERALTNGILFVSNNERSYQIQNASIDGNGIRIYKNASYRFKAKGMDTNYNRLELTNAALNWSADKEIGRIDSNGTFTAGDKTAVGKVTANVGAVPATAEVRVFSDIPVLKFSDTKTVAVQKGVLRQFILDARDTSGNPILIGASQAKWSVSGNMGKIDKNGLLTVTAKSGSGVVTAEAGGKKASVTVSVMPDFKLVDDFEHNDSTRYFSDGTIGSTGLVSADYFKSGKYSYKLSYDYDSMWDRNGTGSILLMPTFLDKNANDTYALYTSATKPKLLGMWIYGDGQAPPMSAQFSDSEGNSRSITIAAGINWKGWKYISVPLPTDLPSPMTLEALNFQETNKTLHKKGTIYIDDIKFIYSDNEDNVGPAFAGFQPAGKIYTPETSISVKLTDPSGIEKASIQAKLDGMPIQASYDEISGVLSYTAKELKTGSHTFEAKAMDKRGNITNPAFTTSFHYSAEADTTKPVLSGLMPSHNSTVRTTEPRIAIKVKDDKSGVNGTDVNILLDGNSLKVLYDESSGCASAAPPTAIAAGLHKISISAKDRAGNRVALATTSFTVNPIKQPQNAENFSVSVLSDSHATEFGSRIFSEVAGNRSELVLQNGDLIDKDSSAQWSEGIRQLGLLGGKQVMLSPGNHETSAGSISNFNKYFGLPTYSFQYGNSLFISLNSSIGQSISASDPTQFDYLKGLLDNNRKKNIFIYTHVPTRDNLGINHAMPASDTKRLEGILTAYKKANMDRNINVIFGHLHVMQSWSVGGVNYTVDGNECLKKYASPDAGGYMGYTSFQVNGGSIAKRFVLMADSIAIVDNAVVRGQLKLLRGAEKKLNLYGEFSYSTSDYIALLNNVPEADIEWVSQNPSVASVAADGTITAKANGEAVILASVKDQTARIRITVLEPSSNSLAGFKIALDANEVKNITAGKGLKLRANGYDIYGNSFKIDNHAILWTSTAGTIVDGSYTAPSVVTTATAVTLSASYQGMISRASLTVKPGASNASSGAGVPDASNGIDSQKQVYVIITADSLNIRSAPSTSAAILGKLNKGDRVEVRAEDNGWLLIHVNDRDGYISKDYTRQIN